MNQKRAFQLAVVAAFFFAVGFTYEYHLPQIESWLLLKIEEQAAKHSPVQVFPKRLRLSLVPLGVSLEDTRVVPKPGLDKTLAPTELKQVAIGINVFSLLRGEVRLSRVIFRDSTVTVFLKPELFAKKSGSKPGGPLNPDILKDLPIDEIQFENMTFMGRLDPQALVFKISELDLDLVNLYNSIYLYVGSPSWQFKPAGPYPTMNMEAQVRGLMDATELRISALKVKSDQSFVVASGLLNGDFLNAAVNTGRFSLRSHIELPDIANWVRVLPEPPSLPKMAGQLNLSTEIAYKGKGQKPDVDVALDTKGVAVDKFRLGDLAGKLAVTSDSVSSENLHVHNEAGDIKFEDLNVKWTAPPAGSQKKYPDISLATTVGIEKIELRQFLENLGVKHVPIHLDVSAHAPCKGSFDGHLNIRCEGDIHGEELVVKNMSGKKTIVKAKQFHGKGFATVDENKVTYEAEARMSDKSTGRSKGVIDYDKGFKIDFEGDNLEFSDIQNLVDLKLEGSTKVKGSTEGDSSWATVKMDLQPKNFWLEDFGIGDFTTQMTYKSGHLLLQNIDGQYGVSRYSGSVDINLREDTINVSNKMSYVDLKDLKSLLMRRLPIPVDLTGTGSGQITASGPLDIEKLNYHVTSNFYRGTIARETYDSLHFDIDGINGVAHTRRVQATKANGQLEMRGILKPAWSIDSVFVGRALRLEQSELIATLGLDLQGQTDFNVVLRGPIKKPHLELNGRLSKVIIADQPQEDSNFRLDINSARLAGSGSFLGNKIQSQIVYPFETKNPFALEFKTTNWDFTNLFSLISKSANQSDFQTGLSMEAKLHSDEGGFWNSSGSIDVKDLHLRKGSETMKSDGPMKLIFKNGVINSENFVITSGDNFLKLNVQNFSRDHLNADLNGKLNLGMLGLLTPFINDLRGNVALSVDLKGSAEKPLLSGSTFIDKAYVKLRDFPHPFSNLRADLLFNQQTLMINAFNGELGGGKLTADGRISFIARDNVPVDIKGTFSDVALNIPDGYRSRGSGDIAIKGQKFPYLMAINYNIVGGDLTAEFAASNDQGAIKASPYLPKFVKEESFDPFQFDVKVDLVKPVQVSNSVLKAQVQGQAEIKGTPDHLLLTGNFAPLPGGKFMVRDQAFDIQTGYVEYANFPPENPRVYLTASAHVTQVVTDSQYFNQTPVGSNAAAQAVPRQVENQYDISLLVQGRVQPQPQITFSSQPPLSQRDIVSLLALGMTSTALDEQKSSSSNAISNTAVGSALLQQPVGKKLKESLGVDVKVSTAPPTATDPTAAPMVTFSKQWTPKFSSSASSTFGNSTTNGVKLEYKMNRNISVIGSWDNREQSTTVFEDKKESGSIFGLDLEYRVNFK